MTTASTPDGAVAPAPLPPVRRLSKERATRITLLAVGLALLAWYLVEIDRELLSRYGPALLRGLKVTLQLVAVSILFGAALGVLVAFGRLSRNPLVGWPTYAYSYFFRGTPLLAQTFLFYYGAGEFRPFFEGLGLWWLVREPWWCALLIFTLNTAAYQGEIYKGAIASVPRGQWEAARSLGLGTVRIFRHVVAPQAAMTALRPLSNEVIFMVKGSAIASIITILDLMGETRRAFSRTLDFELYFWAAALYLVIVEVLRRLSELAEKRLTRHLAR